VSWAAVHAFPPQYTIPWRSNSFESRCRARIRSARAASRTRTRSRADSSTSVGTRTGTTSSRRSSRASSIASRASVLTRSPAGRTILDAAATSQRTPAAVNARANPNPVGPVSYTAAHGPGRPAIHRITSSASGTSRALNTSPVVPSIAAAATDRACTSSPTLVRSMNTGASHNCRIGRAGGPCSVTHECL
jgi:hypothetical protein